MKKFFVLGAAVMFCLSGIAGELGETWVITKNGKIECKKVSLGYNKARIMKENGQKETVAFNAINSFSLNGKVYDKLPVYENGQPGKQSAFMQLIKSHGDLSLYKLGYHDVTSSDPREISFQYFLYNGTKMHLKLNEKSLANICLNFGVTEDEL